MGKLLTRMSGAITSLRERNDDLENAASYIETEIIPNMDYIQIQLQKRELNHFEYLELLDLALQYAKIPGFKL